jgi:asparagine synthase (glutamine-hydrolysing)
MTILALLLCNDPVLLKQRQHGLEQHLARQPGQHISVRPMAQGVQLAANGTASMLADTLDIGSDSIGRLGWSRQRLAASGKPAAQYFDNLKAHMPAMSALWWWDSQKHHLTLAADPVGARPLYYFQDQHCILVTSALWLMEACPWIDLTVDEASLHQRILLGYCLNGTTPYRRVQRLQGGTRVTLQQGAPDSARRARWHRFDAVATGAKPLDVQLDAIQHRFMQAIADQDDGAAQPVAALSGGLDTRSVIGGLLAAKRPPTCLTFTWRNSLDACIATQFADAAHVQQHVVAVPRPLDEPFLVKSAQALKAQWHGEPSIRLWTGYGGSVGAGYVHSNADLVAAARADDMQAVARGLLKAKAVAVSKFLFGAAQAQRMTTALEAQIIEALVAHHPDDPGRRVQLYLLENQEPEQLRALTENADILGFDVAAPFYDHQLLEQWCAIPLDDAVCHRAYVQWLERLPDAVTAVPWQAYPGHVRSALPMPAMADQWQDMDEAYLRQLCANDLAFVDTCRAADVGGSPLIADWWRQAVQLAVSLGMRRQSYLLRLEAAYAAFAYGKGAQLLDGV